jgi:hypothetical protein
MGGLTLAQSCALHLPDHPADTSDLLISFQHLMPLQILSPHSPFLDTHKQTYP